MAGNQTPGLDCGAPLVEWGEARCIACDLRMTLVKDCDPLLELSSTFLGALAAEAKTWARSQIAEQKYHDIRERLFPESELDLGSQALVFQ